MRVYFHFTVLLLAFLIVSVTGCSSKSSDQPVGAGFDRDSDMVTVHYTDSDCATLYAGKTIDVGAICFEDIDTDDDGIVDTLLVKYSTKNGWGLNEIHFWIGDTLADLPAAKNGNPIPGQFTYKFCALGGVENYSFEVPFSDFGFNCDMIDNLYYVAAHAAVRKNLGDETYQSESAWGEGTRIVDKGNWATYFTLTISCEYEEECGPITGKILSPEVCPDNLTHGETVDFTVIASSGGIGNIVLYEVDYDYDGVNFIPSDSNSDGIFIGVGPFYVDNPCENNPQTFKVAFRATDNCNPPNQTIFATCDVKAENFDLPSPINATVVHYLASSPSYGIAINGDYAYIHGRNRLYIYNINPPETAYLVNSVAIQYNGDSYPGLDIVGDYAYVAGGTYGLHIVDINPPESAYIVDTITLSAQVYAVEIEGNYAYIANYSPSFLILNIENPLSPYLVKAVESTQLGWSRRIHVSDGYAYIAYMNGGGLQVADIDPPEDAYVVYSSDSYNCSSVDLDGNYVYTSDRGSGQLRIYENNLPSELTLVKTVGSGAAYDVEAYCGYAYAGLTNLKIYDVVPYESTQLINQFSIYGLPLEIAIRDGYAFIAASSYFTIVKLW